MTKVAKRSGEVQDFDRRKVEESLKNAGASEDVATRVAGRIQPQEGMATAQIRAKVAEELRRERADLAEAYLRTVRLNARTNPGIPAGRVQVPEVLQRIPDLAPNPEARIGFGNKWAQVSAERALKAREVWVNQADLQRLGASDGARVAVHFPRGTQPPAARPQTPRA